VKRSYNPSKIKTVMKDKQADSVQELYKEAAEAMLRLLPPDEYGENSDCSVLWYALECLKLKALEDDSAKRLNEGRDYLMGVQPDKLSVEDALEAFGFGRNGLETFNPQP
jgi:hypothetical protein